MQWFWYFFLYSFFGFLLEVAFSYLVGTRSARKCTLLLPLCPVYGLGACGILALPETFWAHPLLLALMGALIASAVEYLMALVYEKGLGVSFWDYQDLPGNFQGRICLPFSVAWGVLSLPLVYWFHPGIALWVQAIPFPVTLAVMTAVGTDLLFSAWMLKRTKDRSCLEWYRT